MAGASLRHANAGKKERTTIPAAVEVMLKEWDCLRAMGTWDDWKCMRGMKLQLSTRAATRHAIPATSSAFVMRRTPSLLRSCVSAMSGPCSRGIVE